jgi:hypothetical protein
VSLEWQTASEINNHFFTVERSVNGREWTIINRQDGAGNSYSTLNYSYIDHYPHAGESYYRLKQTDFDGKSKYSATKSVSLNHFIPETYKIYPNPAQGTFIVECGEEMVGNSYWIVDKTGKKVETGLLGGTKTVVHATALARGLYFIKVEGQDKPVKIIIN